MQVGSAGSDSAADFEAGRSFFPDGIDRATVERNPAYVVEAKGASFFDIDRRRFLDLNNNFTRFKHGNGLEPVIEAVALVEIIISRVPDIDCIRFMNTGTKEPAVLWPAPEASLNAPRLIRLLPKSRGFGLKRRTLQDGASDVIGTPRGPAVGSFADLA